LERVGLTQRAPTRLPLPARSTAKRTPAARSSVNETNAPPRRPGGSALGPLAAARNADGEIRNRPSTGARVATADDAVAGGAGAVGGPSGEPSTSRTKTSPNESLSSLLRLSASESNATRRPSPEIAGLKESPSPAAPEAPLARLTNVVVFACRSCTKMLSPRWASPAALLTSDWKAAKRPSAEIEASNAPPSIAGPVTPLARLTSVVALLCRFTQEDVPVPIVVLVAEVRRVGLEGDEVSVGGDRGLVRAAVRGRAGATRAADERRGVGLQIAHEDVEGGVAILVAEVARV
jgi:hypothetical protein